MVSTGLAGDNPAGEEVVITAGSSSSQGVLEHCRVSRSQNILIVELEKVNFTYSTCSDKHNFLSLKSQNNGNFFKGCVLTLGTITWFENVHQLAAP